MTSKPATVKDRPNTWTQGGQAKSSDVVATTAKFLLKTPEADDKNEIAGRMYEACDLRMAIEGGHLKTLDDVLAWAKTAESGLQALMELPVWVITENACVDIKASIAHNQGSKPDAATFTSSADSQQFKLDGGSRTVTFDTPPASGATPPLS